jgi:phosphoribosylanthranilate isomerase
MRVKICGITQKDQGKAIAELGATTLGFVCVSQSPRYVTPEEISHIIDYISSTKIDYIGVFANVDVEIIREIVSKSNLTGVQLHGNESPQFCRELRQLLPNEIELIKAFRVKTPEFLVQANSYLNTVDTLLLDAYHPHQLGGTGTTLNWQQLADFKPTLPWFLAGGLRPDNILQALKQIQPQGIDLSSGVERSPGYKDINKVAQLFEQLQQV